MIVRISGEGQYRLDEQHQQKLNELDNRLVELVNRNDKAGFNQVFREMIALVREQGSPLPVEELVHSDVIIPPPETTLEDAQHLFQGEGLVPG